MSGHLPNPNHFTLASTASTSSAINWPGFNSIQGVSTGGNVQSPTPHYMPQPAAQWNMDTMPWKVSCEYDEGTVHYFTAQMPNTVNPAFQRKHLHQKRKSDLNTIIPAKQFITEEKITNFLKGLHISNDYAYNYAENNNNNNTNENNGTEMDFSEKGFVMSSYDDYQAMTDDMKDRLGNANRITLCEDFTLLNHHSSNNSMLPASLKSSAEQTCTDLVLWKPSPIISILKENNEWHCSTKEQERTAKSQHNDRTPKVITMDEDLPPLHPMSFPTNPIYQDDYNCMQMDEDC